MSHRIDRKDQGMDPWDMEDSRGYQTRYVRRRIKPQRIRYEKSTPYLFIIGTILIGISIILYAFMPRTESLLLYTIASILLGNGIILIGLGSALNVKAHWDARDEDKYIEYRGPRD